MFFQGIFVHDFVQKTTTRLVRVSFDFLVHWHTKALNITFVKST